MIVCVLLVWNSRGCCLAAPGDHEGAATIFSTATNILSIKSNLKFESWTTAVFVAMSPRYLGGKYHSRLSVPVFAGDWTCEIELRQTGVICFPWRQRSDRVVYLKVEFQMHTVLYKVNGEFYTTMMYPCFNRSVCFSMGSPAWWRFGLYSSGSSLVSRWLNAPLLMWRRRCKQTHPC